MLPLVLFTNLVAQNMPPCIMVRQIRKLYTRVDEHKELKY